MDRLIGLLNSKDSWIVINAAFALGEIGSAAGSSVPILASLLRESDPHVVKAILEALACIGCNTAPALPELTRLLYSTPGELGLNDDPQYFGADSIHYNVVYVLLLSDLKTKEIEPLLIDLLKAPTASGRVCALSLEILARKGSEVGLRHAVKYLQAHRWDDSVG